MNDDWIWRRGNTDIYSIWSGKGHYISASCFVEMIARHLGRYTASDMAITSSLSDPTMGLDEE